MKNRLMVVAAGICVCGVAFAAANGAIDAESGAYVVNVASGDVTLSVEDVTALGTSVDLVKRGAGRLIINTNLKTLNWGGELRVEQGFLRAKAFGALGTNAKGTIVSDGATFEIDGAGIGANQTGFIDGGEAFTITGKGMQDASGNYLGVLRNVSNDQYPGISPVTMLGDCLYTTAKDSSYRFDFRSRTVNMNGHTLTTRGYFAFTTTTIQNPGDVVVEEGKFVIESSTSLGGDAANTFTLKAGSQLWLQGARLPLPWTLRAYNGVTVQTVSTGTDPSYNKWTGPVELVAGTTKMYSDYRYSPLKIVGDISGAGGIDVTSISGARLELAGENTFTGGLTISKDGVVYAPTAVSIPLGEGTGPIRLTGTSACLAVPVGDDASTEGVWTSEQYQALMAKVQTTGNGSAVAMWNDEGQTKTYAADVETLISLAHGGTGTLALTGSWLTGDLMNLGGWITAPTPGVTHVRFLDLAGGSLRVPTGGCVYSHTNAYMGARWPDVAKIVVENGACYMTSNASPSGVYPMYMGRTLASIDKSYRAILDAQSGACVTGRICVGYGQGSTDAAAFYLRPGAYFRSFGTGSSCDMYVGSGGNGYMEIASDAYLPGWTTVGSGSWGRGVWVQKGGSVRVYGDAFAISTSGAKGEAYFCGGAFTNNNEIHVAKSVWSYTGKGSHASLTVAGDANVVTLQAVGLAMQSNSLAAVNLNGGVLQAKYFQKGTNLLQQVSASGRKDMAITGNSAYVNFNGGTFRAHQSGELFPSAPDRVNVYAGGATFDTQGYICTVGVPLEAPTGKGIASIPLPASCSVPWNYIGSPYVTIEGDGTNAWAHAVFDSETGVVTGIEVTNPGTDYTWARARLERGGWTNLVVVNDLPLADNTAGGLTKKGLGTLTLLATNSFQGPVSVENGRLVAGNDRALPTAAFDLSLTGGTLDGGRQTWTFGAISATSGVVENVSSASTARSLVKTGEGTFLLADPIDVTGDFRVEGGTFVLPQTGPGLWEGARSHETAAARGADYNASPIYRDRVSTSLYFLHTNSNGTVVSDWTDYMNVTYSGYIWNTNDVEKTWCFAGVLDDGIKLVIDGQTVFSSTSWTTPKFGKITVAPGPHSIYIICYNGTDGAGATGCGTYYAWPSKHGFVWNPDGAYNEDGTVSTNYTDYVDVTDATRGAVFSVTAAGYEPAVCRSCANIQVNADATLVVGDGAYAFENFRGLGNIQGSTSIRSWTIDGAEVAAGKQMHVTGDLTFPEGAAFLFENFASLPASGATTTIATVDGTITGTLPPLNVPNSGVWSVFTSGHQLKLGLMKGTMLIFR